MTQILNGTPVWVWPLFIALLVVGLRARHARQVPVALLYGLPLMGLSGVSAVAGLSAGLAVWGVFALFYLLGCSGGYAVQQCWILGRSGRMVYLAGESLTLVMIMCVFLANFVGGFLQAVAPQIYGGLVFQILFAAVVAVSSGSFAGRALRVAKAPVSERIAA